jgi:hypothetical protein
MKQIKIICLLAFALFLIFGCAEKDVDISKVEVSGSVSYEYKTNL